MKWTSAHLNDLIVGRRRYRREESYTVLLHTVYERM